MIFRIGVIYNSIVICVLFIAYYIRPEKSNYFIAYPNPDKPEPERICHKGTKTQSETFG